MIQSASEKLNMPMDKFFINIQHYGNTSAASIPIALAEAFLQKRIFPGDLIMMIGFGAGLSWGVTVMQVSHDAFFSSHAERTVKTVSRYP